MNEPRSVYMALCRAVMAFRDSVQAENDAGRKEAISRLWRAVERASEYARNKEH